MRAMEQWPEHRQKLLLLVFCVQVCIQNQVGRNSRRLGKTGQVIEVRQNDQCIVWVNVCDRVTLRNHKFLRK